jgi:orotate phosphoribosyltransferase
MARGKASLTPKAIGSPPRISGHLKDMATIIPVDSVVNTGRSVLEFVEHIRSLNAAR